MVNLHIFVWFAISLNSIKKIICEMLDDISSHKPIEIILVLSIDLERIKGAIVIRKKESYSVTEAFVCFYEAGHIALTVKMRK
ncbi:MAG: hypothetical protein GX660_28610 [Clostridiaceae bacterium]|nr:hypothetical protein [Clostridiaceae bacterium]